MFYVRYTTHANLKGEAMPKATHRATSIVVESMRGNPLPIDMLRYDQCAPATEGDASLITRTHNGSFMSDPGVTPGLRIHLHRYFPHGGNPAPNVRRWESFGWRVLTPAEASSHLQEINAQRVEYIALWDMPE